MNRLKVLVGVLVLGVWLTAPGLVQAGLGIVPTQIEGEETRSWFVYTLGPGESHADTVLVNNHSDEQVTVVVEALDALSTTSGGYALVSRAADNKDIGQWISLDKSLLTIGPRGSAEIGFRVEVPESASVGEHNGGIVVYAQDSSVREDGVKVQTRVAARVYVTVPGVVERDVRIDGVTHKIKSGQLFFTLTGQNLSNVKLEPAIDVSVRGLLSSDTQAYDGVGTFLAGSPMTIDLPWDRPAPRFGYYRVAVNLHTWTTEQTLADGTVSVLPNETFSFSYGFWVGPIFLWILLLVVVIGWLAYRAWVYLSDRRKYLTKYTTHTVKQDDTVVKLAQAAGVSAKQIIRLNALVWPYAINPKDKLLIPQGRLSVVEAGQQAGDNQLPNPVVYLVSWRSSLYHPERS